MTALLLISAIAIIYALIRAKHDSHLNHGTGKWKAYAFIEGVFIAAVVIIAMVMIFDIPWGLGFLLGPIFGFIFWIFFDCTQGYMRTKNILHIGTIGFDLRVRNTVKGRLWLYLFWKLFFLGVLIGGYLSF